VIVAAKVEALAEWADRGLVGILMAAMRMMCVDYCGGRACATRWGLLGGWFDRRLRTNVSPMRVRRSAVPEADACVLKRSLDDV
jgi:hypothetical protein